MPFSCFCIAAATVGLAGAPTPGSSGDERQGPTFSNRVRDDWMLSLEAVTHAPIDAGFQLGGETPFGLRVFAGYGWIPAAYIDSLVGLATTPETRAGLLLDSARYSGESYRFMLGIRPFRRIGAYLDAGYVHAHLDATRAVPSFSVSSYTFPGGTYRMRTGFDLWAVELGYQIELERRLLLALALGVTGAFDSATTITPVGAAPSDPALGQISHDVDHVFETNVLPTLTLRLGFDLI